jgi:CSLREA domain-containing protein
VGSPGERQLPAITGGAIIGVQPLVIAVDATTDAADASPGDKVCASAAAECTLRAAIMEANAHPGPDTIVVPAGTYLPTIPGNGEDSAATGDLDITDALVLTDAGPTAPPAR